MKYIYYNLQVVLKSKNIQTRLDVGNFESSTDAEIVKFAYLLQSDVEDFSFVDANITLKRSETIPVNYYFNLKDYLQKNPEMSNAVKLVKYDYELSN